MVSPNMLTWLCFMSAARLALQIPSYLDRAPGSAHRTLAPLAREEFISQKLAPKLAQQLKVGVIMVLKQEERALAFLT
jgi:hypothetical protein